MRDVPESSSDCECQEDVCTCLGLRHVRGPLKCLKKNCGNESLSGWRIANLMEAGLVRKQLHRPQSTNIVDEFTPCISRDKLISIISDATPLHFHGFLDPDKPIEERDVSQYEYHNQGYIVNMSGFLQGERYEFPVPEYPERGDCLSSNLIESIHELMQYTSYICRELYFSELEYGYRDSLHDVVSGLYTCIEWCWKPIDHKSGYNSYWSNFGAYYTASDYAYYHSTTFYEKCHDHDSAPEYAIEQDLEYSIDMDGLPHSRLETPCGNRASPVDPDSSDDSPAWKHSLGEDVFASFSLDYDWTHFTDFKTYAIYSGICYVDERAVEDRWYIREVKIRSKDSSSSYSSSESTCRERETFIVSRSEIASKAKDIGKGLYSSYGSSSSGDIQFSLKACVYFQYFVIAGHITHPKLQE